MTTNLLIRAIDSGTNLTTTLNGAVTYKGSGNPLLDFYGRGAALRGNTATALELFMQAYDYQPEYALKLLFWVRDVPGRGEGAGERDIFRILLYWLAQHDPEAVLRNLYLIPYYGRWDDLMVLLNPGGEITEVERATVNFIREQLGMDLYSDTPSLCAKWMPSENASSKTTQALARRLAQLIGHSAREYRVTLSTIRRKLNLVETALSQKRVDNIDFSKVPSRAMYVYGRSGGAFQRLAPAAFQAFLNRVERGEASIKATTLFPYDIVGQVLTTYNDTRALDLMWEALPDYLADNPHNGIAVVDTSSSMYSGRWNKTPPIWVSIALGLYIAERNTGAFHNTFLTFNSNPTLEHVRGETVTERINNMYRANWGGSTNLQATFDLILNRAVEHRVPQSEMPEVLYIISDMEFNCIERGYGTNLDAVKAKYARAGYKMPAIVFWNVDSKTGQVPALRDSQGITMVSGASQAIFKGLLAGGIESMVNETAEERMYRALDSERYAQVS